jgi:hypothetical protein
MNLHALIGPEILRKRESPIYAAILATIVAIVLIGSLSAALISNIAPVWLQVLTGLAGGSLLGLSLWFIVNAARTFLIFGERGAVRIRAGRTLRTIAYTDLIGLSYVVQVHRSHGLRLGASATVTLRSPARWISISTPYRPAADQTSQPPPPIERIRDLASTAIADGMLGHIAAGQNVHWSKSVMLTADAVAATGFFGGTKSFPIEDVAFGMKFYEDAPIDPESTTTHLWLRGTKTVIATLLPGAENYYPGLMAFQEVQLSKLEQLR